MGRGRRGVGRITHQLTGAIYGMRYPHGIRGRWETNTSLPHYSFLPIEGLLSDYVSLYE